ncbi:MAG: hypothetical protein QXX65_01220 [Candidatus Woesearchaeota archaeon]
MAVTSLDERLSFAVITDPAGNMDFLRRAVLELPYREIERTKKSKKPRIQDIEAIFVIGRLVDPLFKHDEERAFVLAQNYLQDELEHGKDGYQRLNITDVPGLAYHLKHNAPFKRWQEQDKLIPTIERLVGLKREGAWCCFGKVKDRIIEQYRQMNEIALQSRIPVYFAADTIFLEQVIPEERWLHWKSLLLGSPQEQLIKTVGMTGIDFAIPEYVAEPTMRGNTRFSLAGFEPFQGKVTITYGMPKELHEMLKESKQKIVIAGKQGLFERDANPAEHYPGNLLFIERPLSISFYSFGNEAGVRVVYFLHNNKLMFFPESTINLREMSASAGQPPRQSDAEAAAQMSDMAADMMRVLPLLEKQNPELAQKIRKAGFDRPQQLARIIDFLNNQYEIANREKHEFMMQFVTFLDEIIKHAKLFEWYQSNKKSIYEKHGIAPGMPASHAVEMEVFELGINTAKEALKRRETNTEQAFNRCLVSIEEIVDCLGLRGWYDEQKEHLSQRNGATSSDTVMELYPLAIIKIKRKLAEMKTEREKLVADAMQKSELEARLAEKQQAVDNLDKRFSELLETYNNLEAQRDQLVKDNESLQKRVEDLTSGRQDYDELLKRIQYLEASQKDYDSLKAQIDELLTKLKSRDDTIKLQTKRLDELGDENDTLTEKLDRQVRDNDELRKENENLLAALQDYNALKVQLASLEQFAKQLKSQHPSITAEDVKGIFDAYKAMAENALSDSKQVIETLQKTLREQERQLRAPIVPDEQIQEGIRTAREEIQKRYDQITAQVKAEAQKFKEEILKKYTEAKAKYESQLAEKDRTIADLESKLKNAESMLAKPAESSREIAQHAYLLVEQGDLESGIAEYTRAINTTSEKDPLIAKMLVNRGRAFFKNGNYLCAYADFVHASTISPTYKNINQLVTTAKEYMERQKKELEGKQDGKEKTITP